MKNDFKTEKKIKFCQDLTFPAVNHFAVSTRAAVEPKSSVILKSTASSAAAVEVVVIVTAAAVVRHF